MMIPYLIIDQFPIRNGLCRRPWIKKPVLSIQRPNGVPFIPPVDPGRPCTSPARSHPVSRSVYLEGLFPIWEPETYQKLHFRAPAQEGGEGFHGHSQRLTVPKKVCLFIYSYIYIYIDSLLYNRSISY